MIEKGIVMWAICLSCWLYMINDWLELDKVLNVTMVVLPYIIFSVYKIINSIYDKRKLEQISREG
jgi:hypothetical protein